MSLNTTYKKVQQKASFFLPPLGFWKKSPYFGLFVSGFRKKGFSKIPVEKKSFSYRNKYAAGLGKHIFFLVCPDKKYDYKLAKGS